MKKLYIATAGGMFELSLKFLGNKYAGDKVDLIILDDAEEEPKKQEEQNPAIKPYYISFRSMWRKFYTIIWAENQFHAANKAMQEFGAPKQPDYTYDILIKKPEVGCSYFVTNKEVRNFFHQTLNQDIRNNK